MKHFFRFLPLLMCLVLLLAQSTIHAKPDLTFSSFTIGAITPGNIIHHSGNTILREYPISFVGCEPFAALGAGATRAINNGTIKFNTNASAINLKLKLYVDADDCQTEFFTPNSLGVNAFLETAENNNFSVEKSIPINSDILAPNKKLTANQYVISPNGKYKFIFQADGNLVLYKVSGNVALWASRTDGQAVGGRCVMQPDGNLVIYKANGQAVWSTYTYGGSFTGSHLSVQDDANVVIYKPDGSPSWSTQTYMEQKTVDQLISVQQLQTQPWRKIFSNNRKYFLEFTTNGNLELRIDRDQRILWQSGTTASGGKCKMQPDGNFVIYNSANSPVWDSSTYDVCDGGSKIVLQDDGNLVIYRTNGGVAWTTETDGERVNTNPRPARRLCD